MYLVIPLFVSEIADTNVRGVFGSMLSFFRNVGLIFGYVISSYVDYYTVPWIAITPLILFFFGYCYAQETPEFLVKKGDLHGAELALKRYRDLSDERTKAVLKEIQAKHERTQLKGVMVEELRKFLT